MTPRKETVEQAIKRRAVAEAGQFAREHPVLASVLTFVVCGNISLSAWLIRARPLVDPFISPVVEEQLTPVTNLLGQVESRVTVLELDLRAMKLLGAERDETRTNMWRAISELRVDVGRLKP